MPLTGLVGERILCMHGGISPHLKSLDQLRKIERPTDAAGPTLEMDLLWADPVPGLSGFQSNMRGASYGFGADILTSMCQQLNIDMVARAHQVVQVVFGILGAKITFLFLFRMDMNFLVIVNSSQFSQLHIIVANSIMLQL